MNRRIVPSQFIGLGDLVSWELVAEGGEGVVWKAYEPSSGRWVAVKFVALKSEVLEAQFRREAQIHAALSAKRGVLTLYQSGVSDGYGWLKLEYCPGGSLQDHLDRFGPISGARACAIMADVAEALSAAHSRQRLHCDVKPANILIDEFGDPKLADFGLSRALRLRSEEMHAANTDATAGLTPAFTPPEAVLDDEGRSDPPERGHFLETERTAKYDVWLVAATLYALVMGRPLRTGVSMDLVDHEMTTLGFSSALRGVVERAFNVDPAKRPPMDALAEAFSGEAARLVAGNPSLPSPRRVVGVGKAGARPSRRVLVAGTVLVGATALGGLLWWLAAGSSSSQPPFSSQQASASSVVASAAVASSLAPTSSPSSSTVSTAVSVGSSSTPPPGGLGELRLLDGGVGAAQSAGEDPSAAIDSEGAVVVYSRFGSLTTALGRCTGRCDDFSSKPIAAFGSRVFYPHVSLGSDGVPVVSATDAATGATVLLLCGDRSCSKPKRIDIPRSDVGARKVMALADRPSPDQLIWPVHSDVAVGAGGRVAVVFDDAGGGMVKLALCSDAACSSVNVVELGAGFWPAVEADRDGRFIVAYSSGGVGGPLAYVHCDDDECARRTTREIPIQSFRVSIATSGSSVVVVALDATQAAVVYASCVDLACSAPLTGSVPSHGTYPEPRAVATRDGAIVTYRSEVFPHFVVLSCSWPCTQFREFTPTERNSSMVGSPPAGADLSGFGHDSAPLVDEAGRLLVFASLFPETGGGQGATTGTIPSTTIDGDSGWLGVFGIATGDLAG